jgi:hypothetical protein
VHDQNRPASKVWVRMNNDDLARLDGSSPAASRLSSFADILRAEHLSCDALWDRVRQGEYQAFRMAQGQSWQWRLQRSAEPAV